MAALPSRLEVLKVRLESAPGPGNRPRPTVETPHRASVELKRLSLETRDVKVGHGAQEFSVFKAEHAELHSAELLRQGALIVSFFSGRW